MKILRRYYITVLITAGLFVAACTPQANFSIGDYTWNDENMNGIQDEGESSIGNVDIALYDAEGTDLQATTTSDKDGHYQFPNLPAGDYSLRFTPPTGFAITEKDAIQDDTRDSDIYPGSNDMGWTDVVTIGPASNVDVDAGFYNANPGPTSTPTPEVIIQSPTAQPISGSAPVNLTVTYDKANHKNYVALGEKTNVEVNQSEGTVELTFTSENGETQITLMGPIDESGAADLTGTGLVAGFQNVSGTFIGMVEVASDGTVLINGELTLGANGELPQAEPIIFEVSS